MKTVLKLRIYQMILLSIIVMLFSSCSDESGGGDSYLSSTRVKDFDGNEYGVITIGDQVWFSSNLHVGNLNDGSPLLSRVFVGYEWASAGQAFCIYPYTHIDGCDSVEAVIAAFGVLYNWDAVNSKKLCPTGFRVPTDEDWDELVTYLGGEAIAGGKVKSRRTAPGSQPYWESPNTGATDNFGFKAVPSGFRSSLGQYDLVGYYAEWWSSTQSSTDVGHTYYASYDNSGLYPSSGKKKAGYAVRCMH